MGFTAQVNLQVLVPILDSVAAHIAAKLEAFDTDERTLTDELCDMACVWLTMGQKASHFQHASRKTPRLPATQFRLTLTKTTAREEARTGADLKLIIGTPSGTKRVLCQAKVLDPRTMKLRCDSTKGWNKLRTQLKEMSSQSVVQPYLLLYVPAAHLDGACHGYPTWEQGFACAGTGGRSSRFGATAIEGAALLNNNGRWIHRQRVSYNGSGGFQPSGVSFARMILELLVCLKGHWSADTAVDEAPQPPPFRQLTVRVDEIQRDTWEEVTATTRTLLRETPDDVGFGAA